MLQAGPNSQFGGVHEGLRSVSYHAPGRKMAPVDAAAQLTAMKAISAGLVDEVRPGSQVVIRALPAAADAPYDVLASELKRCLTGERR